jgi:hypothetical protein
LYLLVILIVFLSERTNFVEVIDQAIKYFYNHYILLLLYGLIFSIVILMISAYISYGIYKNLEL